MSFPFGDLLKEAKVSDCSVEEAWSIRCEWLLRDGCCGIA